MELKSTLECSVVMLPRLYYAEPTHKQIQDGSLLQDKNGNLSIASSVGKFMNLHLLDKSHYDVYFTSDEHVRQGDWVINVALMMVHQYDNIGVIANKEDFHKIVAATDTSLNLPAVPPEWLRTKYVPANGSIKIVKLELEHISTMEEELKGNWEGEDVVRRKSNNEVVIVDEPKIVNIEGGLPKSNHDGTMSITPLVAVYEDGSRSDDKNPEKLLKDAAKAYSNHDREVHPDSSVARKIQDAFRTGWEANPNKWSDDEVVKMMEGLVYDDRKEVGSVTGGLSTCNSIAKHWLAHYKKTHSKQ